ncbi:MAG: GntR family transcriptional regulator [Bacillota bacterium]|nr:GntR family transcriptional regulator [Bacillota bacterium]
MEKASDSFVTSDNQSSKVYIEILKQLREMISVDKLKSGDKIPSERELSERLNVGRSSVREALRALELLGLIETRRGEGTYIKDFHGNQLIKLLSTFILQEEKAKQDVIETKHFIEMDCLRLLLQKGNFNYEDFKSWVEKDKFSDDEFFYRMIEKADNHLLLRIWVILKDFNHSLFIEKSENKKKDYHNLIRAIEANDMEKTLTAYWKLRKCRFSNDRN